MSVLAYAPKVASRTVELLLELMNHFQRFQLQYSLSEYIWSCLEMSIKS
jgi:hypothetical protein